MVSNKWGCHSIESKGHTQMRPPRKRKTMTQGWGLPESLGHRNVLCRVLGAEKAGGSKSKVGTYVVPQRAAAHHSTLFTTQDAVSRQSRERRERRLGVNGPQARTGTTPPAPTLPASSAWAAPRRTSGHQTDGPGLAEKVVIKTPSWAKRRRRLSRVTRPSHSGHKQHTVVEPTPTVTGPLDVAIHKAPCSPTLACMGRASLKKWSSKPPYMDVPRRRERKKERAHKPPGRLFCFTFPFLVLPLTSPPPPPLPLPPPLPPLPRPRQTRLHG